MPAAGEKFPGFISPFHVPKCIFLKDFEHFRGQILKNFRLRRAFPLFFKPGWKYANEAKYAKVSDSAAIQARAAVNHKLDCVRPYIINCTIQCKEIPCTSWKLAWKYLTHKKHLKNSKLRKIHDGWFFVSIMRYCVPFFSSKLPI